MIVVRTRSAANPRTSGDGTHTHTHSKTASHNSTQTLPRVIDKAYTCTHTLTHKHALDTQTNPHIHVYIANRGLSLNTG